MLFGFKRKNPACDIDSQLECAREANKSALAGLMDALTSLPQAAPLTEQVVRLPVRAAAPRQSR